MPNVKLKFEGDNLVPDDDGSSGDFSTKYQLTRQLVHEYNEPIVQDYISAAEAARQAAQEAAMDEQAQFRKEQSKKQAEGKAAASSFADTQQTTQPAREGELQPAHGQAAPAELAPAHTTAQTQAEVGKETQGIEDPMIDPTMAATAGMGGAFKLSMSAGKALMPSLARAVSAGVINAVTDPIYGTGAEVVGATHPALAVPFNLAVGLLGGMTLEPAIERGIIKAATAAGKKLDPAVIAEQVQVMKGILANEAGSIGKDIKKADFVSAEQNLRAVVFTTPGRKSSVEYGISKIINEHISDFEPGMVIDELKVFKNDPEIIADQLKAEFGNSKKLVRDGIVEEKFDKWVSDRVPEVQAAIDEKITQYRSGLNNLKSKYGVKLNEAGEVDDLTKSAVIEEINAEIGKHPVSDALRILKDQRGSTTMLPGSGTMPPAPVKGGKSGVPKPPDMQKSSEDLMAQPKPDVTTEYAGDVNLRLWGRQLDPKYPKEFMGSLVDAQNTFLPQTEEARRYVQTWKQGEAKSANYSLEDMLGRRLGQSFNQEQIINAQDNFINILANFKAESTRFSKGGMTDIDKSEYMKSLNLMYAGMMQMNGITAEAARAFGVLRRMKTVGNMKIGELNEFMKGISNLPPEKIAEAIASADSPSEIAGLIRASKQATTWNMFKELWVNLLIGPYSQIANFAGNTVSSLWMTGEHGLASIISQTPLIGSKEIIPMDAIDAAYGWVEGWKDGLKLFGKAWKTGTSQFGDISSQKVETGHFEPSITAKNMRGVLVGEEGKRNWAQELINKNAPHILEEGGPYAAAADAIGEIVRSGFGFGGTRTLTACDDLFKSINYRMNLRFLASQKTRADINSLDAAEKYLKSINFDTKGLNESEIVAKAMGYRKAEILTDPIKNAPELSMESAKAADYATFTNDLNPAGKAALNLLQKAPPLQLITPFFKTPWNVNKWAMQRSPIIGQLFPSFWSDYAKGGATRDLLIARTAMGSALAGVTGYLAYNGFITGGGPTAKDKKLRSSLFNTNWKPYSVTFDGINYYPYKYGGEPLSTIVGWTADAIDIFKSTRSDDPEVQNSIEGIAAAVSLGWSKNALNTTFLSGLTRFIEAVDDPDRYGKPWVQGFAGSFMPGALRDIEKIWSPERKDVQSLMDMYKSKIPGFSDSLPRIRNRWGEIVKVDNRFMSNETQVSVVDNELIRIRTDLPKPRMEQIFEINGNRTERPIELNSHQREDLIVTMNKVELQSTGETIKKTLQDVIKSTEYKEKTPEEQGHLLRRYWNEALRLAKKEMIDKYPDIQQRVEADIASQIAARQ